MDVSIGEQPREEGEETTEEQGGLSLNTALLKHKESEDGDPGRTGRAEEERQRPEKGRGRTGRGDGPGSVLVTKHLRGLLFIGGIV